MLTKNGKLVVFEDFRVDESLPKYKRRRERSGEDDSGSISFGAWLVQAPRAERRSPIKSWLSDRLRRLWARLRPPAMPVEEFFEVVKAGARELPPHDGARACGYERSIDDARRCGQTALVRKLEEGLEAHKAEVVLAGLGMGRHLLEEDLVRFYKSSSRGLRLDWVADFTGKIPPEVAALKERADQQEVFDNYVVLYYDSTVKSFAQMREDEAAAERARRRDPILFGLVRGRRALYVVGDWVDETCDLTLDQLAEAVGREALREAGTCFKTPPDDA